MTEGSLYSRPLRIMLKWAHGTFCSRKVKSRIEAANFNPRRLIHRPHYTLRTPTLLIYLGTHPKRYGWLNGLATDLRSFTSITVARVAESWWPLTRGVPNR